MNNLASAYEASGKPKLAVPLLEEVLRVRRVKPGLDHPDTLTTANNLAAVYWRVGLVPEAIRLFEDVLARRKSRIGASHPDALATMGNLTAAYLEAGRNAEARDMARECLKVREASTPEDWRRYLAMSQLGAALTALGQLEEAEGYLLKGHEGLAARRSKIPPPRRSEIQSAASRISRLYDAWGKPAEAASWRRVQDSNRSAQ
jgi:tetratricopeptide (TPR) repeat protein